MFLLAAFDSIRGCGESIYLSRCHAPLVMDGGSTLTLTPKVRPCQEPTRTHPSTSRSWSPLSDPESPELSLQNPRDQRAPVGVYSLFATLRNAILDKDRGNPATETRYTRRRSRRHQGVVCYISSLLTESGFVRLSIQYVLLWKDNLYLHLRHHNISLFGDSR